MSSINAVKTKMIHKDTIKICSLQKGEVWVPGARHRQNDVAKTSQFYFNQVGDAHTFSAYTPTISTHLMCLSILLL